GMLLCAAAIPSVATATVPVTVAVAASDVEEEAVEASAVGAEQHAEQAKHGEITRDCRHPCLRMK
ncbi:hypothetical protein CGQ14_35555, partial [Pseudomonas aeruginosa]